MLLTAFSHFVLGQNSLRVGVESVADGRLEATAKIGVTVHPNQAVSSAVMTGAIYPMRIISTKVSRRGNCHDKLSRRAFKLLKKERIPVAAALRVRTPDRTSSTISGALQYEAPRQRDQRQSPANCKKQHFCDSQVCGIAVVIQ